jgi:hypothetical protein
VQGTGKGVGAHPRASHEGGGLRRAGRASAAAPLAVGLALAGLACERGGGEGAGGPPAEQVAVQQADTAAAARAGVLYVRAGDAWRPLVAVHGAGPARDTLPLAWPPDVPPEAGFALGKEFGGVAASPDGRAVAFWTAGVHSLVAVTWVDRPGVVGLDFLIEGQPVELRWAPDPRFLALLVERPDGAREVRVYRTRPPRRLSLPWDEECRTVPCAVADARWAGGSLLTVFLQQGEDEVPVPYEVDVSALEPPEAADTTPPGRAGPGPASVPPRARPAGTAPAR